MGSGGGIYIYTYIYIYIYIYIFEFLLMIFIFLIYEFTYVRCVVGPAEYKLDTVILKSREGASCSASIQYGFSDS